MIENLQIKQAKGAKLHAKIKWELSAKNTTKLSSSFYKYLKDRICKIKQYLNYILMIINQNILEIPRTFSNLQKMFMKNFTPWR